jgi:hypothetical protein
MMAGDDMLDPRRIAENQHAAEVNAALHRAVWSIRDRRADASAVSADAQQLMRSLNEQGFTIVKKEL